MYVVDFFSAQGNDDGEISGSDAGKGRGLTSPLDR